MLKKKSLRDYTIGEMKDFCSENVASEVCDAVDGCGCPFKSVCEYIKSKDMYLPGDWDLQEGKDWTEQDKEDANYILGTVKVKWVARNKDGSLVCYEENPYFDGRKFFKRIGSNSVRISRSLVPSLQPCEKALLRIILGDYNM